MNIMSLCWLFFIIIDSALFAQSNVLIAARQTDLTRPWLTLSQTFDHQFHFEITLPTYQQDIQVFNSRYFPRISSLYWETEREGKTKTSIGLQPIDWGLGLYRQNREPWFGLNTLEDKQFRLTHGGYAVHKNIFWWLSAGSQYQSSHFLHYPLLKQSIYPLIHMGIYQKGFLGEWGAFLEWEQIPNQMWQSPLNSYVSLRLLPDVALKNETLLLLTESEIDLEFNWSQIWQLEYKKNNNGFRFEVGYFPQNFLQPHVNQQVFIVPTPMNQTWKQSSARTQNIPITSYFRMVTQTQSGNWMLRVGTSWINQPTSESRIWNPNQKSKEFMLRLGRYISINNKKHQIRLVCDGALHVEDQNLYWLVLPQIEYTLASKKEHAKQEQPNTLPQQQNFEIQNAM